MVSVHSQPRIQHGWFSRRYDVLKVAVQVSHCKQYQQAFGSAFKALFMKVQYRLTLSKRQAGSCKRSSKNAQQMQVQTVTSAWIPYGGLPTSITIVSPSCKLFEALSSTCCHNKHSQDTTGAEKPHVQLHAML